MIVGGGFALFGNWKNVFAVDSDGRKSEWGAEVILPVGEFWKSPIHHEGRFFGLGASGLYSLLPGEPAKILTELERKPVRSPFDAPGTRIDLIALVDGKIRVIANANPRMAGMRAATYDPADDSWSHEVHGEGVGNEFHALQTKLSLVRSTLIRLSDGREVAVRRIQNPGVLEIEVPGRKDPVYVPVSLKPPADFPIHFRVGEQGVSQSALDSVLPASDLARTLLAVPVVVGAHGGDLIVGLGNGRLEYLYPMVWRIPIAEIEKRLPAEEK